MDSISENLFREFSTQKPQTRVKPATRVRAVETRADDCECCGILQKMIAQQMVLQAAG